MGFTLEASGKTVNHVLLVAAVLGAVGYGIWRTGEEHQAFIEQMRIVTYVLTADEEERKIIRPQLRIPDELRPLVRELEKQADLKQNGGRDGR